MTDNAGYIDKLLRTRRYWKKQAQTCARSVATLTATLQAAIILPGSYEWPETAERWRGLIAYFLREYGEPKGLYDPGHVDLMVGIERYESTTVTCPQGGDPLAVSRVEWEGTPPPGYDPNDPATRASGLFQIPPAYWADRSRAAGFEGRSIFDAEANVATACYMLYASWPEGQPAPHWHHWSAAHVGKMGSYEKAKRDLGL